LKESGVHKYEPWEKLKKYLWNNGIDKYWVCDHGKIMHPSYEKVEVEYININLENIIETFNPLLLHKHYIHQVIYTIIFI